MMENKTTAAADIEASIVIVNYNNMDVIFGCLRSIIDVTKGLRYEIIVVDNASIDGSPDTIKQKYPQVKLIETGSNAGFAAANNLGVRVAIGEYVLFLNPDTVLLNNAVKIFYDFMRDPKNAKVGCCGAHLYDENGGLQISYGNFPGITQILFECGLHKIFPGYYRNRIAVGVDIRADKVTKVDYVSGADMFMKKAFFESIGSFDETFFLYYEETELSYRIEKNGYISVMLPEARILHYSGKSFQQNANEKKMALMERSRNIYFKKTKGKAYALAAKWLSLTSYAVKYLCIRKDEYWMRMKAVIRL